MTVVKRDAVNESAEVKEAERAMVKRVCGGELHTDQESTGSSSEEMESPRFVAKGANKWSDSDGKIKNTGVGMYLHSQVLRIRAEDSHIGEDIGEVLNLCAKDDKKQVESVVLLSGSFLRPASPLSGKTAIRTANWINQN